MSEGEQTVHTEQTTTTPVQTPEVPVVVPDGASQQSVPVEVPAKLVTDPRQDQPGA